MRPRSSTARLIAWLAASLLWAGAMGACVEEETKERFDDDDAQGGTGGTPTAVAGSGGTGTGTTPTGTGTGAGTSTGTGAPPCVNDSYEPNNDEASAVYLGEISDCNGNEGTLDGVLEGTEFDWFWYHGLDEWSATFSCNVGAHRVWDAEATVRVCAYFECEGLTFDCPGGTTPDTSPGGRSGCCSTTEFTVSPDCNGSSDDADVYIRLDKPPTPNCASYSLTYNY